MNIRVISRNILHFFTSIWADHRSEICEIDFFIYLYCILYCMCTDACSLSEYHIVQPVWQQRYFVVGCLLLESIHGPLKPYYDSMEEESDTKREKGGGGYCCKCIHGFAVAYTVCVPQLNVLEFRKPPTLPLTHQCLSLSIASRKEFQKSSDGTRSSLSSPKRLAVVSPKPHSPGNQPKQRSTQDCFSFIAVPCCSTEYSASIR